MANEMELNSSQCLAIGGEPTDKVTLEMQKDPHYTRRLLDGWLNRPGIQQVIYDKFDELIKNNTLSTTASTSNNITTLINDSQQNNNNNNNNSHKCVYYVNDDRYRNYLSDNLYSTYKLQENFKSELKKKYLILASNSTHIGAIETVNPFYYWSNVQLYLEIFIFLLIVVGNLSIFYNLRSCKRRKSDANYFIVQLAIADLLVGLFNVSLEMVFREIVDFPFNSFVCRCYKLMDITFIFASNNLLVALSYDRWEAVVKPLKFNRHREHGLKYVAIAWLTSLLCAAPIVLWVNVNRFGDHRMCGIHEKDPWFWKMFIVYLTVMVLLLPIILIALCYSHIVYTIWTKAQRLPVRKQNTCSHDKLHGHSLIPKARIKTVKMTLVISISFFVCWFPFCLINLLTNWDILNKKSGFAQAAGTLSQSLAHLSSATNPIIYWLFNGRKPTTRSKHYQQQQQQQQQQIPLSKTNT